MYRIYLVMTATGTMFSRFINLFTKAGYNHISLCLDDDIEEFYSFGRKIIWFPLVGGFVTEHADRGVYRAFRDTMCLIYELEISKKKYLRLRAAVDEFICNRHLYRYNLLGLIGVMLNRPFRRKNHYFCTQFVAAMLKESGIHDFKKDASLATPHDFHNIPGITPVYEGLLSELATARGKMNASNGIAFN